MASSAEGALLVLLLCAAHGDAQDGEESDAMHHHPPPISGLNFDSFGGRLPPSCKMRHGIDILTSNLAEIRGAESECCQICSNTAQCKAFAWSLHDGGTCFLKRAKGPRVPKRGMTVGLLSGHSSLTSAVSARSPLVDAVNPTACAYKRHSNRKITSTTIRHYAGVTLDTCCRKCRENSNCRAFTLHVVRRATYCYLKAQTGPRVFSSTAVSGTIDRCNYRYKAKTEITARTIETIDNIKTDECCRRCRAMFRCKAFTVYIVGRRGPDTVSQAIASRNPVYCVLKASAFPRRVVNAGPDFVFSGTFELPISAAGASTMRHGQRPGHRGTHLLPHDSRHQPEATADLEHVAGGRANPDVWRRPPKLSSTSRRMPLPSFLPAPSCQFSRYNHVEIREPTMADGVLPGIDRESCCRECRRRPGCRAFVYYAVRGDTRAFYCILKSVEGPRVHSGDSMVGVMQASPGVVHLRDGAPLIANQADRFGSADPFVSNLDGELHEDP